MTIWLVVLCASGLVFKLYVLWRQVCSVLAQEQAQSVRSRLKGRLLVLAGREAVDTGLFVMALMGLGGVWPYLNPGVIPQIFAVLVVFVCWFVLRWLVFDYQLCRQSCDEGDALPYLRSQLKRAAMAMVWFLPALLCAFFIVIEQSVVLAIGALVVLNWGHLFLMPTLRAKKSGEWVRKAIYSDQQVAVFEDGSNTANTQANARSLAGLFSSSIIYTPPLRQGLEEDEFQAVLGHEKGHLACRHHLIWLAVNSLKQFCFVGVGYGLLVSQFGSLGPGAVLILLFGFYRAFEFLWAPINNRVLHLFEFQADQFAANLVSPSVFVGALKKIWGQNQTVLRDDRLYGLFYSSHPSPDERVSRLLQSK